MVMLFLENKNKKKLHTVAGRWPGEGGAGSWGEAPVVGLLL